MTQPGNPQPLDGEPRRPEPVLDIPGGPSRRSRTGDRSRLPGIAARNRVETLLRTHDLAEAERAFDQLTDDDMPIVRLIAGESAALGAQPAVRYSAIAALGHRPGDADNLNLLTDLARFGEDFYVRAHAMLALGRTGTYAHLEPIMRGLEAEESFERTAAVRALGLLAAHGGEEAVTAHAAALGGPPAARNVSEALQQLRYTAARRPSTPAETSAGGGEGASE
jgi:HEAT repeat protein